MVYSILLAPPCLATTHNTRRADSKANRQTPSHISGKSSLSGCQELAGEDDLYRIREGDQRIIYTIRDKKLIVFAVKIGARKEIYR